MLAKELKMKQKNKKRFLGILAARLAACLLGNMLAGKRMKFKIPECKATIAGQEVIQAGEAEIRACQDF